MSPGRTSDDIPVETEVDSHTLDSTDLTEVYTYHSFVYFPKTLD
jgi:hypothetical protein